MTETDVFKLATSSLYDKYMGPLLFEPFGKHVAESARLVQPELLSKPQPHRHRHAYRLRLTVTLMGRSL